MIIKTLDPDSELDPDLHWSQIGSTTLETYVRFFVKTNKKLMVLSKKQSLSVICMGEPINSCSCWKPYKSTLIRSYVRIQNSDLRIRINKFLIRSIGFAELCNLSTSGSVKFHI